MTPKLFKIAKSRWILIALGVVLIASLSGYWYLETREAAKAANAAIASFHDRDLDAAGREVSRWIKLRPKSGAPWYWKARIELASEHPQESMEALRQAKERGYPEDELKVITSVMQVFGGRLDQMEPILRQAISRSDDPEPELAQALSRIYLASFQFGLATKSLERWMKDAPEDPKPYLWRNEIDERTSADLTPIIRNYREALRRDPSLVDARLGLADKLRISRRPEEAAKEYESYLRARPQSVEANRGAGQVALELGNTANAIRYFNEVLVSNPKEPTSLRELALLDIRSGHYSSAVDRLKTAIEVEPFDPDLMFNYAKALKLAGKIKESEEAVAETERLRKDQNLMSDLRENLLANPYDTKLRFKAARWLLDHGHDKEGLEWTELILKSNPGDQATCLFLADYHKAKGNVGLANYYRLAASPTHQSPPR